MVNTNLLQRVGCITTLLLMLAFSTVGQETNYISGNISDTVTGKPVANCRVFLSNTSKGDITSASGDFMLKKIPAGRYELVISAIGYQTQVFNVTGNQYPHNLKVSLQPVATQLSEVVVQPLVQNGWQKWGQIFLDNFIGTVPNASYCRILNQDVVKFWFSETKRQLIAHADEPLIIRNTALGYNIQYRLESFTLDFNTQSLIFAGYPFFSEMDNPAKSERWKENRSGAYHGSLRHFIRSVYDKNWHQQGFQVIAWLSRPNTEKLRVKKITAAVAAALQDSLYAINNNAAGSEKDSARYYKKILKQPDSLSAFLPLSNLDSLLADTDDGSKQFFFTRTLKILYRRYPKSRDQQSEIFLGTPKAICIDQSGSYAPPIELIYSQYWARIEKLANLLPFDYTP